MDDPYNILRRTPEILPMIPDVFEKQGRYEEAESFRSGSLLPVDYAVHPSKNSDESSKEIDFTSNGDGYHMGFGHYGNGDDFGKGGGYGYGFGWSHGYGDGHGNDLALRGDIAYLTSKEMISMDSLIPGQLYLFMTGDGWAWVGRFVRPLGLFGAYFADNVNICRTGGTAWPELARGKGRENATFQSWREEGYEMPHVIVRSPFPWAGELPV